MAASLRIASSLTILTVRRSLYRICHRYVASYTARHAVFRRRVGLRWYPSRGDRARPGTGRAWPRRHCLHDGCRRCAQRAQPASEAPAPATRRMWNCVDVHTFSNASNALAYHLQCFLPRGLDSVSRHPCTEIRHRAPARLPEPAGFDCRAAADARPACPYVLAPNGTAPRLERRRAAKWMYDRDRRPRRPAATRRPFSRSASPSGHSSKRFGVPSGPHPRRPESRRFGRARPSRERTHFRTRHDLGDDPVVLFLGKLTPRKRVDALVRAFAPLDRPDAHLVIAGNDMGAMPSVLARSVRAGHRGADDDSPACCAAPIASDALAERRCRRLSVVGRSLRACGVRSAACRHAGCRRRRFGVRRDRRAHGRRRRRAGRRRCGAQRCDSIDTGVAERVARPGAGSRGRVRARFGGHVIAEKLDALYHELIAARRALTASSRRRSSSGTANGGWPTSSTPSWHSAGADRSKSSSSTTAAGIGSRALLDARYRLAGCSRDRRAVPWRRRGDQRRHPSGAFPVHRADRPGRRRRSRLARHAARRDGRRRRRRRRRATTRPIGRRR